MRKPDIGFAPREVAAGDYTFQAVIRTASRTGSDQVKTLYPHAHLLPEQKVASLGYETRSMIEQAQAQRVTVSGGKVARRREARAQVTLDGIAEREHKQLQEDIQYAEEMINAASIFGERFGDPDTMFPGVYPNVIDQYRDFDSDPDRFERMFLRTEAYRREQHTQRLERKMQKPRERRRNQAAQLLDEERIEHQGRAHLDAAARQRDLPIRYDL